MPSNNPSQHNARGSLWNRWDLHFHTPSSFDYENGSVTNQSIVDGLVANGIRVVAVLNETEMQVLRSRRKITPGGFQSLLLRLKKHTSKTSGQLDLTDTDLKQIQRYAFDYKGGGFQATLLRVFSRTLGPNLGR